MTLNFTVTLTWPWSADCWLFTSATPKDDLEAQCDLDLTLISWLLMLDSTNLNSCPEMCPVFCRSNTLKASRISSSESLLWIFLAIMLRNSAKSTVPLPVPCPHHVASSSLNSILIRQVDPLTSTIAVSRINRHTASLESNPCIPHL